MTNINVDDPDNDFSYDHYLIILDTMSETHKLISFKDVHQLQDDISSIERFVIMRHDVEFSVSMALDMAKKEHSRGVRSTFFFLHTSDYNIFEEESALKIAEILELGHDIGLHYDMSLFERLGVNAEEVALQQKVLMEDYWKTKVYAMSSHMPMRSGKTISLPDVIDVYDPKYMKDIKYLSDSTQKWREGVVTGVLNKYPHIHLLTHECYWSHQGFGWEALLLSEAKRKFDEYTQRAEGNILKFTQGLKLRAQKDAEFQKRYHKNG